MNVAAGSIKILHLLLICFVLGAPFLPPVLANGMYTWPIMGLHAATCASLLIHWTMNSNRCVLTDIECQLRGVEKEGSFFGNLVGPVYAPPSQVYYSVIILLASISVYRAVMGLVTVRAFIHRPSLSF